MMARMLNHGSSTAGWHLSGLDLECPRAGLLYRRGFKGSGSSATIRGELLHIALAHHHGREIHDDIMNVPDAIDAFAEARFAEDPDPYWDIWRDPVKDAMNQYSVLYGKDLKTISVEEEYRLKITAWGGGEFLYTQRADWVCEERGKIFIVDHKGTSAVLKNYGLEYLLAGQMLGYRLIGEATWGKKFGGVKINAIRLTESGDIGFRRFPLRPAAAQPSFVETLRYAYDIRTRVGNNPDPMKVPGTHTRCQGRFGRCPYWNICLEGAP
jgi:hypothetical protein